MSPLNLSHWQCYMVLQEKGKRLPTLAEYVEMLLPIQGSQDDEQVNQFGAVTTGRQDEFFLVQTSPGRYRMMPGPEFSPRLYRGQTRRYPTCKPQLFRDINPYNAEQKYSDLLFWNAKQYELARLMLHHPALRDILSWDFDGLVFDIDMQAIAQHYGYPTQMLDLTRRKDIGMYFATHALTGRESIAEPVIGSEAVLYTIDVRTLLENQKESELQIVPVGVDPLPRSAAQGAFALELSINEDLEQLPGVEVDTFIVSEELASTTGDKVGGSDHVFPYDPFEMAIAELRNSTNIDRAAIQAMFDHGRAPEGMDVLAVMDVITGGGYTVTAGGANVPDTTMLEAARQEWEKRRARYISRIKWRAAADAL